MLRKQQTVGMLVAVGLALGAVSPQTFSANRDGSTTLAFLIARIDIGFHYGKSPPSVDICHRRPWVTGLAVT